jgi:hypothetical protein
MNVSRILRDEPVATDAREGARTAPTCLAVVESTRTGQPQKVPNHFQ